MTNVTRTQLEDKQAHDTKCIVLLSEASKEWTIYGFVGEEEEDYESSLYIWHFISGPTVIKLEYMVIQGTHVQNAIIEPPPPLFGINVSSGQRIHTLSHTLTTNTTREREDTLYRNTHHQYTWTTHFTASSSSVHSWTEEQGNISRAEE